MPNLPPEYNHSILDDLFYPMVKVEPGIFIMGNENGLNREKPEHLVKITRPFYIGKYPVSQAVWKSIMDGHNPSNFIGDQRPVEGVSWLDIVEGGQTDSVPGAFLDQLNENFTSEIPSYQFRLPREAEWEYAAKGGHKTALSTEQKDSFLKASQPAAADLYTSYAGSDQLKEVGWYSLNSHEETKEIGRRPANDLGLHEMSGNVWEWCQDWYDGNFYAKCREKGIVKNPVNEEEGLNRVGRGGSWFGAAGYCRVSARLLWNPTNRNVDVGFRLVLALVQ